MGAYRAGKGRGSQRNRRWKVEETVNRCRSGDLETARIRAKSQRIRREKPAKRICQAPIHGHATARAPRISTTQRWRTYTGKLLRPRVWTKADAEESPIIGQKRSVVIMMPRMMLRYLSAS